MTSVDAQSLLMLVDISSLKNEAKSDVLERLGKKSCHPGDVKAIMQRIDSLTVVRPCSSHKHIFPYH